MARIRTIKPEFPHSESIGRLSRDARLLFVQLWTIVDDAGRTRAPSRMLASLLYPYDDDAPRLIDGWLDELEAADCIRRYQVGGAKYLDIPKWLEHQKIDRPSKSHIPAFDEGSRVFVEASSGDLVPRTMDQEKDIPPSTSEGVRPRLVETPRAPKPPYPEAFEALWAIYRPIASPNSTKADAHKAWAKLDEPTKAHCAEGLALYVAWLGEEKQRRDGTKVKHLETFISKRGWEPFIEARPAARTRQLWVTNDDDRWPTAVERYRAEKGKPPPAVAGTQGNIGMGWFFPAEYLEPRAA